MCSWMSTTIGQVLDLNNRAVFFINEARYLLAIPPLVRCARCDEWTVSTDVRGLCGDREAR